MTQNAKRIQRETSDPWWVRATIVSISISFVALMLVLPLLNLLHFEL